VLRGSGHCRAGERGCVARQRDFLSAAPNDAYISAYFLRDDAGSGLYQSGERCGHESRERPAAHRQHTECDVLPGMQSLALRVTEKIVELLADRDQRKNLVEAGPKAPQQ
jgi:hypothetical protein